MNPTAREAFAGGTNFRAYSRARARNSPRARPGRVDQAQGLRLVHPERRAFRHHSIAFARPTARPNRCVPPVPGSTPSDTSGSPSFPAFRARDPQIASERDLQPAADAMAVDRRDHQLGRLLQPAERLVRVEAEVVLEVRIRLFEHGDVRPAQKNFSPAPVSSRTCTDSSMRASRMCASSSRIIS